jgi:hypothetical protein
MADRNEYATTTLPYNVNERSTDKDTIPSPARPEGSGWVLMHTSIDPTRGRLIWTWCRLASDTVSERIQELKEALLISRGELDHPSAVKDYVAQVEELCRLLP